VSLYSLAEEEKKEKKIEEAPQKVKEKGFFWERTGDNQRKHSGTSSSWTSNLADFLSLIAHVFRPPLNPCTPTPQGQSVTKPA